MSRSKTYKFQLGVKLWGAYIYTLLTCIFDLISLARYKINKAHNALSLKKNSNFALKITIYNYVKAYSTNASIER